MRKNHKMKKFICSMPWGSHLESDEVLADCHYYAEVKVIDPQQLGILKRCSIGSKAQNAALRNIMGDNEILRNQK